MIGFIFSFFKILLLIILPFVLLIKGATHLHNHYYYHAWINVLGGVGITVILLSIYLTWFYSKLTGKIGSFSGIKRRFSLSIILVFGFALQGLMYISAKNIKSPELKQEFRNLHPILRLSISTLVILDRKAILTDAQRTPEDYKKMGLPSKQSSLHYKQKDGYVHAVDLRTKSQSDLKNWLLSVYFKVLGFRTLRHIGTADHLHISLKNRDRPSAL